MKCLFSGVSRVSLGLIILGIIFSCASAPSSQGGEAPPEWVMSPPEPTSSTTYFVGSGSDATGNMSEAEKVAAEAMISEITRYMGVRITTETSSEAKATMDDFSATMTQTVKAEGSARVSGFKIEDKWVTEEGGEITVYILGAYNTADLEKEKARIAALFREQQEAVSGPEREGNSFMQRGQYYQAALKYIEAASAASSSSIENAEIKVERNINNAKEALGKINLVKLNDNLEAEAAAPFTTPFRLKVAAGPSESSPGIPDVAVKISFKEKRSNGRMAIKTARLESDSQGIVEFTHPVPSFVGEGSLSMSLDIQGAMDALYGIPSRYDSLVISLEDAAVRAKALFEYTVISRAREISTGILVLDADKTNSPYGTQDTASGLLQELTGAQFDVKILAISPDFLLNASDAEILARVRREAGGQIERLIYGVSAIEDFSESGSAYMVKVRATLKVAELSSGRLLYSNSQFKRARGSTSQGAIATAFRQLGGAFGEGMASELP